MQDRSVFFVDFKHIQENTPSVLIDNFEFAIACWNGLDWFGLYLIFHYLTAFTDVYRSCECGIKRLLE